MRLFILALVAVLLPIARAGAAAPQVRRQAPGYYRLMLGDIEITALSDGSVALDLDKLLTHIEPGEVRSRLERAHAELPVETSINAFLINTGRQLILIDAGAGEHFGQREGALSANLVAAGYRPEQVDAVLLTHVHGDHSAGLTIRGKPVFPNAQVYLARSEFEYWCSKEEEARAREDRKPSFREGRAALAPYLAAGRVHQFVAPAEVLPGIQAIPAPGHTPGHTMFRVERGGRALVLCGDIIHAAAVQLDDPGVTIRYDVDEDGAARERRKVLPELARRNDLVGAAHVSFPGLGTISENGGRFAWVPVLYRSVP